MKPNFALSLSLQGIALLHRAAGGWRRVGEVAVDAPDLARRLAGLRERALELDPDGPRCKLIIPDDQIRYLTLDTGAVSGDDRLEAARAALQGATPYTLDELAFDISVDGPRTHVAAVARETLAEAESFAVEHRFDPVSFVAAPGDSPYLGEPFFGTARHAASLPGGDRIEPDGISVVVIGDALPPARPAPKPGPARKPAPASDPAPVSDPAPAATTDPKPAPAADPKPAAKAPAPARPDPKPAPKPEPVPGFSSRRARSAPATPDLGGATRDIAEPPARRLTLAPADDKAPQGPPRAPAAARPGTPPPPPPAKPEQPRLAAPAAVPPVAPPVATAIAGDAPPDALRAAIGSRPGPGGTGTAKPDPAPRPTPAKGQRVATSPRIEELPPDDETARLTLFGARAPTAQRGKPRHLGLILTAALLLVLIAIAAWASIFLDNGIASLWQRGSAPAPRIVTAPDPEPEPEPQAAVAPDTPEPATPPAAGPGPALPQLAALPDPVAVPLIRETGDETPALVPAEPQAPTLSDTDSAVLDALREPDPGAERKALYAATGIWDQAPPEPETPSIIGLDDLYVASIDRTDLSQDAVALPPAPALATDLPFHALGSPPAAGTSFDIDPRGQVVATPEGALNPDGVMVYLGRPAKVPPPTPERAEVVDETAQMRERLAGFRPRARPDDLIEQSERSQLGGKSREELARLRPKPRPADLRPPPPTPAEATPETTPEADESDPAIVAVSARPRIRPADLAPPAKKEERTARTKKPEPAAPAGGDDEIDEPEVVASAAPSLPSSASVARQATVENALNLRHLNLIGVYGTAANRRALIRLPSGRYKKVKVGDSVDGGKVVAIGDSELRYQKGSRNLTLKMPKG
jgi:hypothetical protein